MCLSVKCHHWLLFKHSPVKGPFQSIGTVVRQLHYQAVNKAMGYRNLGCKTERKCEAPGSKALRNFKYDNRPFHQESVLWICMRCTQSQPALSSNKKADICLFLLFYCCLFVSGSDFYKSLSTLVGFRPSLSPPLGHTPAFRQGKHYQERNQMRDICMHRRLP